MCFIPKEYRYSLKLNDKIYVATNFASETSEKTLKLSFYVTSI